MSGDALLSFGVEVEMILTPKSPKPGMTRYDIATSIADYHNKEFNTSSDLRMLPLKEDAGTILRDMGYTEWGLFNDGTIIIDKPFEKCQCSMAYSSKMALYTLMSTHS
jgi:hypothetical protein